MDNTELSAEIDRLKKEFAGADENKLNIMQALIEQAAYERIYLRRLNEQAMQSGLVQFHPENATIQRTLPISGEIAKHSAALTNITDKLMKHLATEQNEDDEGLSDYE
jgi:bifunctional N-acetylglucosamine-1-phosphate-uridyltransferase/glucosamine-1-phosphate-acetyltransferase GlmU-like protein